MFDAENYQRLAMRTSPDGHDRMLNGCMGLIGESGEVVDIVKKWKFQSGDHAQLPKDKLIEELGDVLWYCAEISTAQKVEMIPVMKDMGINGLSYDGLLHMEALFLAKLAMEMTDAWLYPDEFGPTPMYIVGHVIDLVGYMLHNYCECTLERCMELNIEKLKRRYPDGFDPERSLHREE
jgi:NTP pyrophosphatase (non-canonical NTP hydrolase)